MKRIFILFSILVPALLLGGCTKEIDERISQLKEDLYVLEQAVSSVNESTAKLAELVNALEKNEHIKSIQEWTLGNWSGYQITFTSGTVLTLRNGVDGVSPILGVRYNEENEGYYWTIQMGPDGSPTWMTNSYGLKVRATGQVPQLKIEDGLWWYSFDGNSWIKTNWASPQGEPGSAMFTSIDTSDPYYVTFSLANGYRFQIPTQRAVEELNEQCETLNKTMKEYADIVAGYDSSVFVKSVVEFEEGGVSGCRITMETGEVFTIRNGYDNRDSVLLSAKAYTDGKYYWVYRSRSTDEYQWLRYNGEMICVTLGDITPYIGIVDSLGQLYFTVAIGTGQAELMRDADGNPVKATGRIVEDFFTGADLSDLSTVVLTLSDGTKVSLPRTREHMPSATLSLRTDYVEAETSYTFQALLFLVDTLPGTTVLPDYASYAKEAGLSVEAVAIDDGYAGTVTAVNFSSQPITGGVRYESILDIPFTTGDLSVWNTSIKSRIAVFISWQNNTIMKVVEFRRAILATSITIPASLEVEVGKTATLTASWLPTDTTDTDINWSSSDTAVATVTADGKVTGVAVGTCTITARMGRVSATCAVTVKAATP